MCAIFIGASPSLVVSPKPSQQIQVAPFTRSLILRIPFELFAQMNEPKIAYTPAYRQVSRVLLVTLSCIVSAALPAWSIRSELNASAVSVDAVIACVVLWNTRTAG